MLPNLIRIGAMKSAATSLHRYLRFHPGIFMFEPKDIDYFIQQPGRDKVRVAPFVAVVEVAGTVSRDCASAVSRRQARAQCNDTSAGR